MILALRIAAFVLFIIAMFTPPKLQLVAAGLACLTLSIIFPLPH